MSMNERERLLAILYAMPEAISLSEMADYLLEHGITAPPTEIDGKYEEKENIRRAIIEELNRIGGCDATDEWSKGWDAAIDEAIKIVNGFFAVYIIRYGEWLESNGIFVCSECEYSFEHEGYKHFFNFCPCCGAAMRGESNDSR